MATRYNINDFALANPIYVGGTVSFYTVSGGAKTTTLATLYAASTGSTTLANPRTLDSDGKFSVPVYVEVPTVATVSGLTVADHDTGIMGLAEGAASTSAAAAAASAAAALVSQSAAGVSAAAALVSENNAAATLAAALPKAGGNLTGGINSARGNITQHATTMDFFAVTSPDILDGTGSAVTITACVNAPQAGATRKFYPIVATVLTHGATFDIAGNANLTAAAGDCWIIEAKTVSTYRVTAVKEDGTPVIAPGASGNVLTSNGTAWASTAPSSSGVPTGSVFDYVGSTEPSGYVFLSGKTIGNGSSGGTARANADTSALFTLLWDSMADAEAPVSSGRGANAAADFAANKTITLPDARGRTIAGKDNMGGTTASRLTNGGSGITGTTLGVSGGTETHTLTTAQLASHSHTMGVGLSLAGGAFVNTYFGDSSAGGAQSTVAAGSGNAHQNTQPTLVLNKIIKL